MERYRNFVRLEQMKENIRAGRNEEALKLADCLNPAAVRSNSDLTIMSDLYLESGMLAKAGACLDELYSRRKTRIYGRCWCRSIRQFKPTSCKLGCQRTHE